MRQRAFTLLETVIALAIAMVVMGATVTANRVVQRNAQIAHHQAQEESLINDTFGLISLTHNTTFGNGQTLGDAFAGLGTNSPKRVVPYRVRKEDPIAPSDPVYIEWCTDATPACQSLVSTATPDSVTFANYTMTNSLASGGAEIIAVRKASPIANQPQIYDFTYFPDSGDVISSTLDASNPAHYSEWDFYRRHVTITNRTTQYGGYLVTVTVWPMIAGVERTGEAISRSQIFTDF